MKKMRYRIVSPIVITIGLLVLSAFLFGRYQYVTDRDRRELAELEKILPPSSAIELKQIFAFPTDKKEEEDQYLWAPNSIARHKKGNYYISDTRANSIIIFDSAGKYINKIGRQGQGPGDLSMPMGIWLIGDEIIVIEPGNRRLQWLDLSGKYLKSIRVFKSCYDLSILNNGELVTAPMFFDSQNENMLIEILSPEGKISRKFGTPFEYKKDKGLLNERSVVINESNEIIQVFKHIPLLQAYSMDGKLLREKMIDTGYSLIIEKMNRRKNTYSEKVGYLTIFKQAVCIGDTVYIIGQNWEYLWIWAVDKEFNINKTYWFKVGKNYHIIDFLPFIDEGQIKYAVLGSQIVAKISVFAQ
jgi:hypothetical protein